MRRSRSGTAGSRQRWWLGTIDDPTATEITDRYDGPPFPFDIAGDRFVATEDGTRWSIHDATTGEQVGSSVEADQVYDVFMHPTGEYVAILGQSLDGDGEGIGRLHLVDARTGTELDTISAERSIGGVAFDTEANEMLVVVEGVALKTYDLRAETSSTRHRCRERARSGRSAYARTARSSSHPSARSRCSTGARDRFANPSSFATRRSRVSVRTERCW